MILFCRIKYSIINIIVILVAASASLALEPGNQHEPTSNKTASDKISTNEAANKTATIKSQIASPLIKLGNNQTHQKAIKRPNFRKCQPQSCLNDGLCTETADLPTNQQDFKCICREEFYGSRCQFRKQCSSKPIVNLCSHPEAQCNNLNDGSSHECLIKSSFDGHYTNYAKYNMSNLLMKEIYFKYRSLLGGIVMSFETIVSGEEAQVIDLYLNKTGLYFNEELIKNEEIIKASELLDGNEREIRLGLDIGLELRSLTLASPSDKLRRPFVGCLHELRLNNKLVPFIEYNSQTNSSFQIIENRLNVGSKCSGCLLNSDCSKDGYCQRSLDGLNQHCVKEFKLKQATDHHGRGRSLQQAFQLQSSLQPKHVAPPLLQPTINFHQDIDQLASDQFLENQNTLALHLPYQPELIESSSEQPAPIKSPPGYKGFGLILPRLAAKLFTGDQSDNSKQQTQQQSSRPSKKFRKTNLVKNLFNRDPLMAKGSLLQSLYTTKQKTTTSPTQVDFSQQQSDKPQSKLVFMNGQVYTVVGSPLEAPMSSSSSFDGDMADAVFDHQTSDTSEFPIFEAMSIAQQQQHMITSPSNPMEQSTTRCDRPRHVIQADRSVVNHILQSQQNFVIARVPIKKYIRPDMSASNNAASSTSNPLNQQVYHAIPLPMLATAGTQPIQATNFIAAPAYAFANTNRIPATVYQNSAGPPSTIEVSASVPRHSILQSLANLVNTIRFGSRSVVRPSGGTRIVSGSSPSAVIVEGPVILAPSSRRSSIKAVDKFDRRRGGRQLWFSSWNSLKRRFVLSGDDFTGNSAMQQQRWLNQDPMTSDSSVNNQIDPMKRLLMLKTATDNEVCSPVSQDGMKIKYSCVPNHCVAMAIANATSGVPSRANSPYVNSNSLYKASNSMQHEYGQPMRPSQQDDRVQVQQFDDLPSYQHHHQPAPLVTYEHVNAYQPSRLIQPGHQNQFMSTTHALEALANQDNVQELDENQEQVPEMVVDPVHRPVLYQPYGQASNIPGIDPNTGQMQAYQAMPYNRAISPGRYPHKSTVTLGTAFVKTSPMPQIYEQVTTTTTMRPNQKKNLVEHSKQIDHFSEGNNEDTYGPSLSSVRSPNEFLSAVDEKLERPIKVPKRNKNKRRGAAAPPITNQNLHYKTTTTTLRPPTTVEHGGSGAENSLIESEAPQMRVKYGYAPQPHHHNQARLVGPQQQQSLNSQDDDDTSDSEDDSDANHADYPEGGGTADGLAEPPNYQPVRDMNYTIPVVNGRNVYDNQLRGKIRRDNRYKHGHTTTQSPARYGQRQSTPLPPPEKSEDLTNEQLIGNNDDDLNQNLNGGYSGNTTECDCNKNEFDDNAADLGRYTATSSRLIGEPEMQQRINSKRNPTTLRPTSNNNIVSSTTSRSGLDTRRQTQSTTPASVATGNIHGLVRYTTKRPYNLRNTTYKNLSLGSNFISNYTLTTNHLASLQPAADNPTQALRGGGDISTTIASNSLPPIEPQQQLFASQQAHNDSHTYKYDNADNQTQFDDTANASLGDPLVKHTVTYNEPEVRSHQPLHTQMANLLPVPVLPSAIGDEYGRNSTGGQPIFHNSTQSSYKSRRRANSTTTSQPQEEEQEEDGEEPASTTSANFKPSSVNDIIAQARREHVEAAARSNNSVVHSAASLANKLVTLKPNPVPDVSQPIEDDEQDDSSSNSKEITPHQYQIQVRWNNSSSVESPPSNLSSSSSSRRKGKDAKLNAEQTVLLDKMKERVRDRLFEHREEEHWHDKKWLKAGKKQRLVAGKWVVVPIASTARNNFDYGPHAHERETPIKDQLSNEPTKEEMEKHFAIPTPNFRQNPKFVDWVKKDVDMTKEPGF